VSVYVDARDESSNFPRQADDAARQRAEFADRDKNENLPYSSGQTQRDQQKAHLPHHVQEDVDLVENDEEQSGEDRLSQLNIVPVV